MLPFVAAPLGADVAPTPQANVIAEQFRQARMHEAVLDVLAAAAPQPTLFLVEDVHNMDDASLQLLGALSVRVPTSPWVLVVTRRPEGPGLIGDARSERLLVELQPLTAEAAALLATLALEAARFDEPDLDTLIGRAGGTLSSCWSSSLLRLPASAQTSSRSRSSASLPRAWTGSIQPTGPSCGMRPSSDASSTHPSSSSWSTPAVPGRCRSGHGLGTSWRGTRRAAGDSGTHSSATWRTRAFPTSADAHLHGAVGRILERTVGRRPRSGAAVAALLAGRRRTPHLAIRRGCR